MKTKNIIIIILCLCIIAFVPGVLGAVSVYEEDTVKKDSRDLIIGFFLTTEHLDLFDMEAYLEDNFVTATDFITTKIEPESTSDYEGRIYAKLVDKSFVDEETGNYIETKEYVFEDIEGYPFFDCVIPDENGEYTSLLSDPIFCNVSSHINTSDTGRANKIEATIYYSGDYTVFYVNPVFQSEDGSVYLMSGLGIATAGETEGSKMSKSLKDEVTVNMGDKVMKNSSEAILNIEIVNPIKEITLSQMNGKNECIKTETFAPGEVPEEYTAEKDAEYFILESKTVDKEGKLNSDRKIIDKNEDYFDTFQTLPDGMHTQFSTKVNW